MKQRGAHHELLLVIGAVVALLGTVGFVGYNTWQNQNANADVCANKNTRQARLGCLQEKVQKINARISTLQQEIANNPKQPKKNAERQKEINQLNAEKTKNNYEGRIVRLQQEIAAANASTSRVAAPPAAEGTTVIRRATTNLAKETGKQEVESAVAKVSATSDVIGFQEIEDKDKPIHKTAVMNLQKKGWSIYWPGGAGNAVAIAWRSDRFTQLGSGAYQAHGGEAKVTPARYVVYTVLQDKKTGFVFANVNGHAIQKAWTSKPEHRSRWELWATKATQVTQELADKHGFVLGSADLNRDKWQMPGATMHYPAKGTFGGKFYDAIWSRGAAKCTNVGTKSFNTSSDHDAVIATFNCTR